LHCEFLLFRRIVPIDHSEQKTSQSSGGVELLKLLVLEPEGDLILGGHDENMALREFVQYFARIWRARHSPFRSKRVANGIDDDPRL
jgi:hypothetical protein